MKVKLHYNVVNAGDGSVYVNFYADKKSADENEESNDEGWGESSVSNVELDIINGKICLREDNYNYETKKYETKWIELKNE